jgi:Family of unknown function (DUF5955)
VSKEKFELAFLAGGALLDGLGTRLRREPATPRESVGAAVHTLGQVMNEYADRLDDPEAARNQLLAIREELCEPKPRRLRLASCLEELAAQVRPVGELAEAVEHLREQVHGYLRRRGGWSLS